MPESTPVPVTKVEPQTFARRSAIRGAIRNAHAAYVELDFALVGRGSVAKALEFLREAVTRAEEALRQ